MLNTKKKFKIITLAFIFKLGFFIQKTNIKACKIDSSILVIYRIVVISILFSNKFGKLEFFEKIFFLTNTSIIVILRMSFIIMLDTNIQFINRKLIQKNYIIIKVLPTITKIKLINKQEFDRVILDKNFKSFKIYIAALKILKLVKMLFYLF